MSGALVLPGGVSGLGLGGLLGWPRGDTCGCTGCLSWSFSLCSPGDLFWYSGGGGRFQSSHQVSKVVYVHEVRELLHVREIPHRYIDHRLWEWRRSWY